MGLFNRKATNDGPKNYKLTAPTVWLFGKSSSGKAVNERTAMQLSAVYACVRVISESMASLPLDLFKWNKDGAVKDREHPLYRVLHDEPNGEMTSFNFRETMVAHQLLWGNAYAQVIRNGKGEVVALYPLMPNRMAVDRDTEGHLYYMGRESWFK